MVELNKSFFLRIVFPRILKATLWGSLTVLITYYVPLMFLSTGFLPVDFSGLLLEFTLISAFFVITGQLFSKTIIGCGLGIARALIIMIYFFIISDGGVFTTLLPISGVTINFTFDLSLIFLMV